MNANVKIPFIVVAIMAIMLFFSGDYPLSLGLYVTTLSFGVMFVGYKTNYKFGKMLPWGLLITLLLTGMYIGLLLLSNNVSWLNAIMEWPVG